MNPGRRIFHQESLCPPMRALGVLGFIRSSCVAHTLPVLSMGSSVVHGFIRACPRCIWVKLVSLGSLSRLWVSLGSSEVVGCIRTCPWCRWLHARSLGLFPRAMGVVGFIGVRCVCLNASWCLWVHPVILRSLRAPLGSLGSSLVVGLTRAGLWGLFDHLGSLVSVAHTLWLIRGRWVH